MNHTTPRYHENLNQRSPCLLVLEVPASMSAVTSTSQTTALHMLKEGLTLLRDELRSDVLAQQKIQLSIIQAGGPQYDAKVVIDWTDARDFELPHLTLGSSSHLAQAMRLALHHVEQQKQTLRSHGITYTRPWIMVVASGSMDEPRVLWDSVAKDCRQAERDKRCVIFPIILDRADSSNLQMFSATPVARLSSAKFREYFLWLSAGLCSTSRSVPGMAVALQATHTWATFNK